MLELSYWEEKQFTKHQIRLKSQEQQVLFSKQNLSFNKSFLAIIVFLKRLDYSTSIFQLAETVLIPEAQEILFFIYIAESKKKQDFDTSYFLELFKDYTKSLASEIKAVKNGKIRAKPYHLDLEYIDSQGTNLKFQIRGIKSFIDSIIIFLWRNRQRIRTCKVCGEYFLREKHLKGEICPYLDEKGTSCTEKLCKENQNIRIENDPLLQSYKKMYKKQYMRFERMINRHNPNLSPSFVPSFQKWSLEAKNLRKQYVKQEIDENTFLESMSRLGEENHPYLLEEIEANTN